MDQNHTVPHGIIQVAGVHDLEETQIILEEGVDLVGIPLRLTVNAEDLSEDRAAEVSRRFPGKCCLITYLSEAREISNLVQYLGVTWLQLHGAVDSCVLALLKQELPNLNIIKSLIIGKSSESELLDEMKIHAPWVSAFITDTFNPETGAEGATGMTHDWAISQRICKAATRPVILAGGLNPENVYSAIQATGPWGVDVHTGVENSSGRKSRESVKKFVQNARRAFSETSCIT